MQQRKTTKREDKQPLTTSDVSQLARRWPWSTGDRVDNTWPVAALTAGIKPDIGSESRFLPTPTCIRRPRYGGSRSNIAMSFGTEKLEWRGYPMVKNLDAVFIRFDRIHECDRHTDRHRMTT